MLDARATPPTTEVQWRAAIAASLGGLLFGFDTAVIAGTTAALRTAFELSAAGLGLVVSAALVGTLVGSISAGAPGDRLGSRRVLVWIAALYIVSAIGLGLAWSLESLVFFRFLAGLAIGGSSVIVPTYIAEISPAARRGQMGAMFQLNIVVGILAAYLSNWAIGQAADGDFGWRVKLGAAALPGLLFLVTLYGIPDSPRWLLRQGRLADALAAIARLRMGEPQAVARTLGHGGLAEDGRLSWRRHRAPILLALAIATLNQFSGINAVLYYLNDIFVAAGFTSASAELQAIAIGVANLLATLLAMTLIDSLGRRPLLMIGGAGCAAALTGIALVYTGALGQALLLPCLVAFIIFFAISQGAVIWVYLAEIFPTQVRARGQALGSATHWIMNAAVSFAFPVIAAVTLAGPFWLFAAAMLVQVALVWRFFPETRGQTLEAVEATLTR